MVNYLKKGVKSYILIINNEGLLLLVNLINDNLIIPKIYFLYDLINWYNIKNYIYILNKKIIIIFFIILRGYQGLFKLRDIFFFENLDKK
jgi:hypothetical protein